jgi:hypothetical protein
MPPKKRKQSNTDGNLDPSSDPTNNNETERNFNGSGTYEAIISDIFLSISILDALVFL